MIFHFQILLLKNFLNSSVIESLVKQIFPHVSHITGKL